MKKIVVVYAVLLSAVTSSAQVCKEPFLGSKTLYTDPHTKNTSAPEGYTPVFINHVGRHGARHLTKDVNTTYLYQMLAEAGSMNALTDDGKLLKEKVWKLEKVEKKNFKSISEEGKKEQQGIADRMYAKFTPVFTSLPAVFKVAYTKEIRTTQTADAFLSELNNHVKEPMVTRQLNDTILRFYDLSPTYLDYKSKGNWMQMIQQQKESAAYQTMTSQTVQRFFIPSFLKRFSTDEREKITADLFGFVTICYSLEKEIKDAGFTADDVNMQPFFSCAQLSLQARTDNAEDFMAKGPGLAVTGIQVKIAVPLLADFINTTDDYINTKKISAQFRFSHAETISPYAALLGYTSEMNPLHKQNSGHAWDAADVIPLSANIQWILYRKKGTDSYLVKFLLNEKETAVKGLSTKTFPYYKWEEVRKFYLKKLKSFQAGADTDYYKYLQEVQ